MLCAILVIAGAVAVYIVENNKKHLQSDLILAQLKYGMTDIEVYGIVGKMEPKGGSGRAFFEIKLPDGRMVNLAFASVLSWVTITKNDREWTEKWGENWLEYDLDKQELLIPFMPDSLEGIRYDMTPTEIEKVFCGDPQLNITLYGNWHSRPIVLSFDSYRYPELNLSIEVCLIRLSTGEWVNMVFETRLKEFNLDDYGQGKTQLKYVNMKADDGKWYVYDLNTQELTEERVPEEKVWEGNWRADIQKP